MCRLTRVRTSSQLKHWANCWQTFEEMTESDEENKKFIPAQKYFINYNMYIFICRYMHLLRECASRRHSFSN